MALEKTNISGIYKNKLKNGDISWYIAKKIKKNGGYTKIGTKNKDNITTSKKAYEFYLKNENTNYNSQQNKSKLLNKTLNEIVEEYYEDKKLERIQKLEKIVKFKTYTDFLNSSEYKKAMNQNKKIYEYSYKKYFINSKLGKMKLKDIEYKDALDFKENVLQKYQEKKLILEKDKREKDFWGEDYEKIMKQFYHFRTNAKNDEALKVLSEKYIFNLMTYVKTSINFYIKKHTLNYHNPFKYLKLSKDKRVHKLRYLTQEEIKKLLTYTKKQDLQLYLCAYLGILTGGRPNTVLNIRKKDISFEEKKIYLTNFKVRGRIYDLPLTNEALKYFERILPQYEEEECLIKEIRNYKDNRKQYQAMNSMPQRFMNVLDKLFNTYKNENGEEEIIDKELHPEKVINYYSLRRTLATQVILQGNPIFVAQKILDHNDQKTTELYLGMGSDTIKNNMDNYYKTIFENIKW